MDEVETVESQIARMLAGLTKFERDLARLSDRLDDLGQKLEALSRDVVSLGIKEGRW